MAENVIGTEMDPKTADEGLMNDEKLADAGNNLDSGDLVEKCLNKWGLGEFINVFKREQIDDSIFFDLPDEAIAKLIQPIGPYYKFINERQKLKIATPSDSQKLATITREEKGEKLRLLLRKTKKGTFVLAQKHLHDEVTLCTIIVDYLMDKNFKISRQQFIFWADEISAVWPIEISKKWYIPSERGKPASGKLYQKYTNESKKIKKAVKKFEEKEALEAESRVLKEADPYLIELQSTPADDVDKLKELWTKTFHCRKNDGDLTQYYEKYPQLRSPVGLELIKLDYELMDVSANELFEKKWPDLSEKLVTLGRKKSSCAAILKEHVDIPNTVRALAILPYLFRPTNKKTGLKKPWKPSYKEQADSFIIWINVITDLEEVRNSQRKLMESFKLTVQPTIIAVGPPKELHAIYVIINDVTYHFNEIIAAVDFCFKSFYALDVSYPVASEAIWIFIQSEIYGINDSKDNLQSVGALRTKLATLFDLESEILEP